VGLAIYSLGVPIGSMVGDARGRRDRCGARLAGGVHRPSSALPASYGAGDAAASRAELGGLESAAGGREPLMIPAPPMLWRSPASSPTAPWSSQRSSSGAPAFGGYAHANWNPSL